MTTISSSSTLGIVLSSPAYTNPVVINLGVSISGGGSGIYASTGFWTIQNAGSIAGNTTSGTGVLLRAGGSITNQSSGTISGEQGIYGHGAAVAVVNYGSIAGGDELGVLLKGKDGGSVTNAASASITGAVRGVEIGGFSFFSAGSIVFYGVGTVVNYGNIAADTTSINEPGVYLIADGSVTNQSSATISGYFGINDLGGVLTVVNAGSIVGNATSSSGKGVFLQAGGSVTNQSGGVISGFIGVYGKLAATTIVNAGSITGNTTSGLGIRLSAGGSVTNQSGATISGNEGIAGFRGGAETVVNYGDIRGTGIGVFLLAGGGVTNQSGATISGRTGIASYYSGPGTVTIVNAGTISGVNYAVMLASGQTNRLIVDPGAVFGGAVNGGNGIGATLVSTLELATGTSTGTLSGLGTQFINFGSIAIDAGANWFVEGSTSGLAGTITGFAQGDTIELDGITVTGSSYAGNVLTLTDTTGFATLDLPGGFTTTQFVVTNIAAGAEISLACFQAGTLIRTTRGEVPVEHLKVGEQVETLIGAATAPIIWIGHRTVDCKCHSNPKHVWPVCVSAGAFGGGIPRRDLWLSPDHAVFVDNVLIPIKHLINSTSITQVPTDDVTYYHIELDRHDVLLADGLPTESYLGTGDRSKFSNGGGAVILHPDFSTRMWEAMGCAPLIVTGPKLGAVRQRLQASLELDMTIAGGSTHIFRYRNGL